MNNCFDLTLMHLLSEFYMFKRFMKVNGFYQEYVSLRFSFFLAEFPIHTTDQL